MASKTCTSCGQTSTTPEIDFDRRYDRGSDEKPSYRPRCKKCDAAKKKAARDANIEVYREKEAASRNKPENKQRAREYEQANRERFTKRRREQIHREKNESPEQYAVRLEKSRIYQAERYYRDVELTRAKRREYASKNRDRLNGHVRKWNVANPDKRRMHSRRRYDRVLAAGGTLTAEQWIALCAFYGNACVCCGSKGALEPDHVVSVANGGSSDPVNRQCLCYTCNRAKWARNHDYRPDKGVDMLEHLKSLDLL